MVHVPIDFIFPSACQERRIHTCEALLEFHTQALKASTSGFNIIHRNGKMTKALGLSIAVVVVKIRIILSSMVVG